MDDVSRLRHEYKDRQRRFAQSDEYSPFNPAKLFRFQQRQRAVLKMLRRHGFYPLTERRILEVGCGGGGALIEFLSYGAEPSALFGIDLLPSRLSEARRYLPHIALACADGQNLLYPSRTFDVIVQFTVLSSILDSLIKVNVAREMLRVLRRPDPLSGKPGGMILWYDFWLNPTNPQTRGIRPAEIRRLFPGCRFEFRRITLAPPITRKLIRVSWLLCYLFERLRIFNTHYLVAIRPV